MIVMTINLKKKQQNDDNSSPEKVINRYTLVQK